MYAWVILPAWIAAVVLAVVPLAHDAFDPVKGVVLAAGAVLCLPIAAVRLLRSGVAEPTPPWVWALGAVAVWAISMPGSLYAAYPRHILGAFRLVALTVATGTTVIVSGTGRRTMLLRTWVGIGCTQAVLVLLQASGLDPFVLWAGSGEPWRVYGTIGNPNLVAALLVPACLLGRSPALVPHRAMRYFGCAIMTAAVVATGSRAGAVILAGGLGAATLLDEPVARRSTKNLMLLLAGIAGLVVGAFSVAAWMGKGIGSVGGRRVFLLAAWQLIRRRPWIGYGMDGFAAAYPAGSALIAGAETIPMALPERVHNDWIELAVELGVLPAIGLAVVVVWVLWYAWTHGARYLVFPIGAMALQAAWDWPLHVAPSALFFWMLIGAVPYRGSKVGSSPVKARRGLAAMVLALSIVTLTGMRMHIDLIRAHRLSAEAFTVALDDDWEAATRNWRLAWELAPSEGEFAYWLAQGVALEGDRAAALELVRQAQLTYRRFDLYLLHARLARSQGNDDEAQAVLRTAVAAFPAFTAARAMLEQYANEVE